MEPCKELAEHRLKNTVLTHSKKTRLKKFNFFPLFEKGCDKLRRRWFKINLIENFGSTTAATTANATTTAIQEQETIFIELKMPSLL